MQLLRASSQALGEGADLAATLGRGDGGVLHGEQLADFAEAATRGGNGLSDARAALQAVIGPEAFVLAAATVGIFNGLVRTADATGIPLDDGTRKASEEFRDELGLNDFAGARSTREVPSQARSGAGSGGGEEDVRTLFSRDSTTR